ncbi:MAG: RNA polymerase sigma factor [Thermomicrobium sp.]
MQHTKATLWAFAAFCLALLLTPWSVPQSSHNCQLPSPCHQHPPPTQSNPGQPRVATRRRRRGGQSEQDDPSERALVEQAIAGDAQAFGTLVERYIGVVKAYLARLGVPQAEQDDLVQEAFTKAWSARAQLRDAEAFPHWLLTITRRCWIDLLRSRHTEERALQHWLRDQLHCPTTPDPSDEEIDLLLRAFDALRPADREILLLRWEGDRSSAELASLLSISPRAAQRRAHRALSRLRETFTRLRQQPRS